MDRTTPITRAFLAMAGLLLVAGASAMLSSGPRPAGQAEADAADLGPAECGEGSAASERRDLSVGGRVRVLVEETPAKSTGHGGSPRGRVVNADGRGLPGASVSFDGDGPGEITGEDGRFPIRAGATRATAARAGYSTSTVGVVPTDEVLIVLQPEAIVIGRVVDATTGAAIRDATVEHEVPWVAPTVATTDAAGRFRMEGIPAQAYRTLRIRPRGMATTTHRIHLPVPGEHEREFRISIDWRLQGQVLDAITAGPVADVDIYRKDEVVARSGPDGAFSIAGSGRAELSARRDGYAVTAQQFETTTDAPVRLWMLRESQLTGQVLDSNGAPLVDAFVSVVVSTEPRRDHALLSVIEQALDDGARFGLNPSGKLTARTDAAGRYRIGGLNPLVEYEQVWIRAKATGRVQRRGPITFAGPEERRLDFVAPADVAAVAGRVVVNGEGEANGVVVWRHGLDLGITSFEGDFALEDVPAGDVDIEVRLQRPAVVRRFAVTLVAGERITRDVEVVVDPSQIIGRVLDDRHRSVPGAIVEAMTPRRASGSPGASVVGRTDAAGRFQLVVPFDRDASWTIRARAAGYDEGAAVAHGGDERVQVVLRAPVQD